MKYKEITWWDGAFHVYRGEERLGIVNEHLIRTNGRERHIWRAHNKHFFTVGGEYPTRTAAAEAIPKGPIHHGSEALRGAQ